MATKDQPGSRSRWVTARESTEAFARKCEELDPDGLTLYVFASTFRRYERVTADRVAAVFVENEPCGGTDLAAVLEHAFAGYFDRKGSGQARPEEAGIPRFGVLATRRRPGHTSGNQAEEVFNWKRATSTC